MPKIAVCGDVHGDSVFLRAAAEFAAKSECDFLVQVGDLGYGWPDLDGDKFMNDVADAAKLLPIMWVPGNHENYDRLEIASPIAGPDPVELMDGFFHLPRASTFTLGGLKFVAMGGAVSVDRKRRTPGLSYWWQESISERDVELAEKVGRADVLLCHDCPSSVPVPGEHAAWKSLDKSSEWNRAALQRVMEDTQVSFVVHGHHHVRHTFKGDQAEVHGLGANFNCDVEEAVMLVSIG